MEASRETGSYLTREQYANLVKRWVSFVDLDWKRYSTHSMRRSKSAAIYQATKDLAACQHLLGHKNIGSTAHYLGMDQQRALSLAKKSGSELWLDRSDCWLGVSACNTLSDMTT